MGLSHTEQIVISVTQKIPAFLSIMGSAMIISAVTKSQKNRSNPQQRIVATMSCIDFLVCCTWLTTNLWVDKDYEWFLGVGNEATCVVQGFIVQFSIGSILYNGCLSIYYLTIVRYSWRDRRLLIAEKVFHAICLSFGLITAICATALGLMHPIDWDCWINSDFRLVNENGESTDPSEQLAFDLQIWFFYIPLWVCISLSLGAMLSIYLKVRSCEVRSSKYESGSIDAGSEILVSRSRYTRKLKRCKEVAKQGRLFITAFVVTWSFPTLVRILQYCRVTPPNWIILIAGTLIPSQGFFNALVYFRLRFERKREAKRDSSFFNIVGEIIQETLFPCGYKGWGEGQVCEISDLEPNPETRGNSVLPHGSMEMQHPDDHISEPTVEHNLASAEQASEESASEGVELGSMQEVAPITSSSDDI